MINKEMIEKTEMFNSRDRVVNVDMDGVLANFHGYFKHLFGWDLPTGDADKKPEMNKKMWDSINEYGKNKFFEELPWIEGSKAMWMFITDNFVNVRILSALGKTDLADGLTQRGKLAWLHHHLPNLKDKDIILVTNKHQKKHYADTNSILIDDTDVVIYEWNKSGGIGILFTSAPSVTKTLEKYVFEKI